MNQSNKKRTIIEVMQREEAVILLVNGDVFVSGKYLLSEVSLTAHGWWRVGHDDFEKRKKMSTIIVPLTSVIAIDLPAKEVPETELSAQERSVLEKRRQTKTSQQAAG